MFIPLCLAAKNERNHLHHVAIQLVFFLIVCILLGNLCISFINIFVYHPRETILIPSIGNSLDYLVVFTTLS